MLSVIVSILLFLQFFLFLSWTSISTLIHDDAGKVSVRQKREKFSLRFMHFVICDVSDFFESLKRNSWSILICYKSPCILILFGRAVFVIKPVLGFVFLSCQDRKIWSFIACERELCCHGNWYCKKWTSLRAHNRQDSNCVCFDAYY